MEEWNNRWMYESNYFPVGTDEPPAVIFLGDGNEISCWTISASEQR